MKLLYDLCRNVANIPVQINNKRNDDVKNNFTFFYWITENSVWKTCIYKNNCLFIKPAVVDD